MPDTTDSSLPQNDPVIVELSAQRDDLLNQLRLTQEDLAHQQQQLREEKLTFVRREEILDFAWEDRTAIAQIERALAKVNRELTERRKSHGGFLSVVLTVVDEMFGEGAADRVMGVAKERRAAT